MTRKSTRIFYIALCLLFISGCAEYDYKNAPTALGDNLKIVVSQKKISRSLDYVQGTHQIDGTHTAISGYQNNSALPAFFLGPVGVLLHDSANNQKGKSLIKTEKNALDIDLNSILLDQIATIQSKRNATLLLNNTEGEEQYIEIRAGLILTYIDNDKILPFTLIKVEHTDRTITPVVAASTDETSFEDSNEPWNTRIFAVSGVPRPLRGENGWLENNKQHLYESINKSLRKSIDFLITDIDKPYPRLKSSQADFQTQLAFLKKTQQITGMLINEDSSHYYIVPKISSLSPLKGTHILSKSIASIAIASD